MQAFEWRARQVLRSITSMRLLLALLLTARLLPAQSPGVPVYPEGRGSGAQAALLKKAHQLREAGRLLPMTKATEQLERTTCELTLPPAETRPLGARERWQRARQAHIRLGHLFLCEDCEKWHLELSGGYAITTDGAVATCGHVLPAPPNMREGYLLAATDEDEVLPVLEILAVNSGTDCAIVRVQSSRPLTPLPLGQDVTPGDALWCFSDPAGKRGYYSEGIVSRFVQRPFWRKKEADSLPAGTGLPRPVWLETTLDWAPGSSGSAVIDAAGNSVGHVSEIQPVLEDAPQAEGKKRAARFTPGTYIVFHQAITAAEVARLVKAKP